ncbi:MAG: tripartite tricarboxylate transporter TctB family protein [Cardiobacteriaceae bacterium]|nr:tripartite tricarboxylate transporter TctB family protein [Cardiobacteriaceae bacterium]
MSQKDSKVQRNAARLFLAALVVLAVVATVEAWRIEGLPGWSSPGAFPLMLSAMLLLSLAQVWREGMTGGVRLAPLAWRGVVFVALVAGFVALLPHAGFALAGFVFLVSAITFLQRGRLPQAIVVAAVATALIYGLFVGVFKVSLP